MCPMGGTREIQGLEKLTPLLIRQSSRAAGSGHSPSDPQDPPLLGHWFCGLCLRSACHGPCHWKMPRWPWYPWNPVFQLASPTL